MGQLLKTVPQAAHVQFFVAPSFWNRLSSSVETSRAFSHDVTSAHSYFFLHDVTKIQTVTTAELLLLLIITIRTNRKGSCFVIEWA